MPYDSNGNWYNGDDSQTQSQGQSQQSATSYGQNQDPTYGANNAGNATGTGVDTSGNLAPTGAGPPAVAPPPADTGGGTVLGNVQPFYGLGGGGVAGLPPGSGMGMYGGMGGGDLSEGLLRQLLSLHDAYLRQISLNPSGGLGMGY